MQGYGARGGRRRRDRLRLVVLAESSRLRGAADALDDRGRRGVARARRARSAKRAAASSSMATGPRATPEYMESLAAGDRAPGVHGHRAHHVHGRPSPSAGACYYERCAAALARGREVYIHDNCQPLSFDFTLRDPYLLHVARRLRSREDRAARRARCDLRRPGVSPTFRENLTRPAPGILFCGRLGDVEVAAAGPAHRQAEGRSIAELAREAGQDPLDFFFDFALAIGSTQASSRKLFQNDDAGVAPLLRHPAGVIALSDAGAHLDLLVRRGLRPVLPAALGARDRHLHAGRGRAAADEPIPASQVSHSGRADEIAPGAWADLLLFDPQAVGVSNLGGWEICPAAAGA